MFHNYGDHVSNTRFHRHYSHKIVCKYIQVYSHTSFCIGKALENLFKHVYDISLIILVYN